MEQQQQSEPVFAGKLAAGAGTFESDVCGIDLRLVRFAATPLAFAPDRLVVGSFRKPLCSIREVTGFLGSFVGCKMKYLFFSQVQPG